MSGQERFAARVAFALENIPRTISELESGASSLPSAELPADLWARVFLVAVHRHIERQAWVGRIVSEQLGCRLQDIAQAGGFGRPASVAQSGRVPGQPDWSYWFHGCGCRLEHSDGTSIDVDFHEGTTDWVDPWFYGNFLESIPKPEPIELRLRRAAPYDDAWTANLETLRTSGLVEIRHAFRLTQAGRTWAQALAIAFQAREELSSPVAQAWLDLALGDPVAAEATLRDDTPQTVSRLAQEERVLRATLLRTRLRGAGREGVLSALAELGREEAESSVLHLLNTGPLDGAASRALEILGDWSSHEHLPVLLRVAQRASGLEGAAPHLRVTSARLAMRLVGPKMGVDERRLLIDSLARPAGASDGTAGLLLCLLDVDRGLQRLRTSLDSTVPLARAESAAALALLGTDEALEVLRDGTSEEATELFAALRGREPAVRPAPQPQFVTWRGERRPVYPVEDLTPEGWVEEVVRSLRSTFGQVVAQWLAN